MSKLFGVGAAVALALTIGLSATPSSARVGQSCGGFVGPVCGEGEFCQLPTGRCFTPEAVGHCVRVPKICMTLFKPVCGCNGMTYGNSCEAARARENIRHNGRC